MIELPGEDWEWFHPYLHLLARLHLDARLSGKLDASDIVRQTLLEAHRSRDKLAGWRDAEVAAWLRPARAPASFCLPRAAAAGSFGFMSDLTRILSAIEQGDPHAAGNSCLSSTTSCASRRCKGWPPGARANAPGRSACRGVTPVGDRADLRLRPVPNADGGGTPIDLLSPSRAIQ